jgi:hypothetical protein
MDVVQPATRTPTTAIIPVRLTVQAVEFPEDTLHGDKWTGRLPIPGGCCGSRARFVIAII